MTTIEQAEIFVKQRGKDGVPKYWIGTNGEGYRMDLTDVLRAMADFAEKEKALERRKAIDEAIELLQGKVAFGYLETVFELTKQQLESLKK